jgi:ribonuclease-3
MSTNYINDGFIIKNTNEEDEIIHIPYNINNILITEKEILDILYNRDVKIDKINHIELFWNAFTHKSYCKKDIYPQYILDAAKKEINNNNLLELQDTSYEILELLGDCVLKLVIRKYLIGRYPKQNEGFITKLQTKIEDKKDLATLSKELGLGKYFIISKQIEQMNGRQIDKIHEDIFEAFMAALFESNGFEPCLVLITNLLETLIDYSAKLYCDNNYKDQLLRFHHQQKKQNWTFPKYLTIFYDGPPHKRKYIIGVEKQLISVNEPIESKCISYGIGSSKKEGQQNAAKMALIIHGILKDDQYTQSDIFYPAWDKIKNFNPDDNDIDIDNDNDI